MSEYGHSGYPATDAEKAAADLITTAWGGGASFEDILRDPGIVEELGWILGPAIFSAGYTAEEMEGMRRVVEAEAQAAIDELISGGMDPDEARIHVHAGYLEQFARLIESEI